jgi:hypothetical protein
MKRFAAYVFLFFGLRLILTGAGIQDAWSAAPTGALNGKVLHQNGSAAAGAKVTIKNLETASIQQTVTDTNGFYKAENLPIGRYQVVAELAQGRSVALNMVDVTANVPNATVAATSAAAQITATVIVNAQAPLVEKYSSEVDRTENTKAILELPGRLNLNSLALLQPGVTLNGENVFGSSYYGTIESLNYDGVPGTVLTRNWGSAFSVNGTRPNSNYFTIDGAYNEDPVRATNRQSMAPENIQTFEMVTANFPAELGRYAGSNVDQIARAGNTGMHGTLMYTWAGNSLNALSTNEKREFDALTASGLSESDSIWTPVSNPFNLRGDRGRSNWDQPHRLVANYTFVIPTIWRDRAFMSRLISGWELSGITTWASGFPYSMYNAQNALGLLPGMNPIPFTQIASVNPGGLPGTPSSLLEPNPVFVADHTNSGIVSNLGRNSLRTGKIFNTDMAFVKNTRTFSEDQYVQLRFEAFNVFNRKNFTAIPSNVVNAYTNEGLFLNPGETNALGRSFMFTARYFF